MECCFVDWLKYLLLVNTTYLSVQKMSMVVTSFNIVCCSKCKVFTHSTIWWNQLNRLGNAFIHKNELKTNEISLVLLWLLFEATLCTGHQICTGHVAFGVLNVGEHGRHAHHVHHHPILERQHALVMRLLFEALLCTHSILHVINISYGHIPHFTVYINSYWIYWLWKLFLIAAASLW